jgi:hypothetical protein
MSEQDGTGTVTDDAIPQTGDSQSTTTESGPAARSFAGELSGAMHTAAQAWHTRLRDEAYRYRDEQIETVRDRADAESVELREGIDRDVTGVEAAAADEIRRIEAEKAAKVEGLHQVLDERLALHRDVIGREVEAAENEIDAYVAYLDGFFGRLSSETDPEAIVRLAGSVPPLPDLAAATAAARASAEAELVNQTNEASTPSAAIEPEEPITTAEPVGPGRPAPEDLVPVMDPGTSSTAQVSDPWLTTPQSTNGDASVTAQEAGAEEEAEPVGVAADTARSSGSLNRLAGFLGLGDSKQEPPTS